MNNLNLVLPEIFISISIMVLLLIGVFKKNSSNIIYNLSIILLVVLFALIINLNSYPDSSIFNQSYKIDKLSSLRSFSEYI